MKILFLMGHSLYSASNAIVVHEWNNNHVINQSPVWAGQHKVLQNNDF